MIRARGHPPDKPYPSPERGIRGFVMPDTTQTTTTAPSRPWGFGAGRPRTVRLRPSYRTGSFEIFTYPHHSRAARVAGAIWRWRVESLCVLTLTVAWVWI